MVDKKHYLHHNETMNKTAYLDNAIPGFLFPFVIFKSRR